MEPAPLWRCCHSSKMIRMASRKFHWKPSSYDMEVNNFLNNRVGYSTTITQMKTPKSIATYIKNVRGGYANMRGELCRRHKVFMISYSASMLLTYSVTNHWAPPLRWKQCCGDAMMMHIERSWTGTDSDVTTLP